MKIYHAAILFFFFLSTVLIAQQSSHPKYEFRGAWIATVINLDWPSAPGLTTANQQKQLTDLLDQLKLAGINAVIFQVRSECDAMYDSPLEPWSFWLTGKQGKAPNPYYDPLEFAIEEAHKRGMELHAWFNPYRASREIGNYTQAENHVINQHPDWIIAKDKIRILNPGIPEVREFIKSVVMDIVRRYDVDGIHYDDYFYPYPPNTISNSDDNAAFTADPRGFTNRGDWRRDNINLFVKNLGDSVRTAKPWVKYGVSPFGLWKSGIPAGTWGLDAYNSIYTDSKTWLESQYVDYLTPQLYWPHDHADFVGQDYFKLMTWWATSAAFGERHLYPGIALYRQTDWPSYEIKNQIRENRENPDVLGSVLFRARNLEENPKGFTDELKNNLYRDPAITPTMAWKNSIDPNMPQNARFELIAGTNSYGLKWDVPAIAADGDSARFYSVYQFTTPSITPDDLENAVDMLDITGNTHLIHAIETEGIGPLYYVVTALNHYSLESPMSSVIEVNAPESPMLAFPAEGNIVGDPTLALHWNNPGEVASYHLNVANDADFLNEIFDQDGITDTSWTLTELEGLSRYYWKVKASNAGGGSPASIIGSFTTGFPREPLLASPTNYIREVATDLDLTWHVTDSAKTYHLQLSTAKAFAETDIILDEIEISDTTFAVTDLTPGTFYYWRVKAENDYGAGNWSTIFRFKTQTPSTVAENNQLPDEYHLWQNYPNPFNPKTTIAFDLVEQGAVHLVVFDLLGREVTTLVDEVKMPGHHIVTFDGSRLTSGIYVYRLMVNGIVHSKRMLLVK
ncbi:MAG: T9SS C-terminal target domain-containing protein [Calditrichaeota bacterium]|nr:MAG: T9SS C-terminal target domain-containing protein [Calditrichota bacterium]